MPGRREGRTAFGLRQLPRGNGLAWLSLIVFVVVWQAAAALELVNPFFVSSPTRVIEAGADRVVTEEFWNDVRVSGTEFLVGYTLGIVVAVPVGILAAWYRYVRYAAEPWLNGFNATPRIALLPLVVVWFGIGIPAIVAIVFLGVFFTVAMNVFYGVNSVAGKYIAVAGSFGASDAKKLVSIVVPGTVPFIVAGARLAIGRGVIGVVVGEFYSSSAGLGNAIFRAGSTLNIDAVLFGAFVITALALVAFSAIGRLEQRFDRWRPSMMTRTD